MTDTEKQAKEHSGDAWKAAVWFAVPILLLAVVVIWLLRGGGTLVGLTPVPLEEITIERHQFIRDNPKTPEADAQIKVSVRNTGPGPATIAVVEVDEAIWEAEYTPGKKLPLELPRLGRAVLTLDFDWVPTDPYIISVITSNGFDFHKEIEAAVETPRPSPRLFTQLGLLGVYVGVIPVYLGLMWLPFLRRLSQQWFDFLLSLTIGLLVFLGADSFAEALEATENVPDVFQGIALVAIGFALAYLVISAVDQATRSAAEQKGEAYPQLTLAYLIAFGIGIHNLGEGLAIGGAYAIGEIALGALLVIGFTIHNTTEGLAIVAPVAQTGVKLRHLVAMGLLGGAPTILGTWIGGFTYSNLWGVLFLAIGAGAIFQVVVSIMTQMSRGGAFSLVTPRNAVGFMVGMAIMYGTGLMVTS